MKVAQCVSRSVPISEQRSQSLRSSRAKKTDRPCTPGGHKKRGTKRGAGELDWRSKEEGAQSTWDSGIVKTPK